MRKNEAKNIKNMYENGMNNIQYMDLMCKKSKILVLN